MSSSVTFCVSASDPFDLYLCVALYIHGFASLSAPALLHPLHSFISRVTAIICLAVSLQRSSLLCGSLCL